LINCCPRYGVMPNIWKVAKVVPLFKSGNKNDFNNYRPISILPIVSKVIESIVFDHIHHYLLENKLLSDKQFGFRKKHSTIDALLGIQKSVLTAVEKKKKVCIISIDLYKAFDSVNHFLLLLKLFMIGFDFNAIKFFVSYLSNRYQSVSHNGKSSRLLRIKLGVFQGSILGPILFAIFINDLSRLALRGEIFFFADDCTLIITAENYGKLEIDANCDLFLIQNWLHTNTYFECFKVKLFNSEFKS
jgi:retron-type reverse transcriptase